MKISEYADNLSDHDQCAECAGQGKPGCRHHHPSKPGNKRFIDRLPNHQLGLAVCIMGQFYSSKPNALVIDGPPNFSSYIQRHQTLIQLTVECVQNHNAQYRNAKEFADT